MIFRLKRCDLSRSLARSLSLVRSLALSIPLTPFYDETWCTISLYTFTMILQ
jgi:hypothetical protein